MRVLPLYREVPRAPIESVQGEAVNQACTRCEHHANARHVCVGPTGTGPGGVLVVVDQVTQDEDRVGALGSPLSKLVASLAQRHGGGQAVLLDSVLKCHPGKLKPSEHKEAVANCSPYLRGTIEGGQVKRIVCAGLVAAQAVLGRKVDLRSVRKGYGWLTDATWLPGQKLRDGRVVHPLPVFLVMHPWVSQTNPFARKWLEEDIAWAVSTPVPKLPPWDAVCHVVDTEADARQADAYLRGRGKPLVVDVETSGRMHSGELQVVSAAVCAQGEDLAYVWSRDALRDPGAQDVLSLLLEDESVPKGGQNAKFDVHALREGMSATWNNLAFDTRMWRKQIDTDVDADLETMGVLVGHGGGKDEAGALVAAAAREERKKATKVRDAFLKANPQVVVPAGVKDTNEWLLAHASGLMTPDEHRQITRGWTPYSYVYGEIDQDVLSRYNAMDTVTTGALADHLGPQLDAEGLRHGWDSLFGPATWAMSVVEAWGFPVDRPRIDALGLLFEQQMSAIEARFAQYPAFNPNSAASVADLLYKQLKLPVLKKTEGGQPSTDKEALESLKGHHVIVDDLLEYRRVTKLKGTYVDGMIPHIMPDGRIHTTFNVDGARSGRMSSSDPNMHNIPSEERGEDGKLVKDCFVAPPGYVLLAADYKQLEFRVAADLSDDPDMKQVFLSGQDFHQATAELIAPHVWGIQPHQVNKSHRRGAKTFNFGIMYGMQDGTIAARAGVSFDEAKKIRQAVMGKFRRFAAWIQKCLAETRKTGHAWCWWHGQPAHRRQLWHILDADQGQKINAENSSYNTPVQGTASFYCMMSVVELVRWILRRRIPAQVVATVHDSIVLLVRQDWLLRCAKKLREVMMSHPTMTGVPLDVDMKAGPAWGTLNAWFTPESQAAYALGGEDAAMKVLMDQLDAIVTPP